MSELKKRKKSKEMKVSDTKPLNEETKKDKSDVLDTDKNNGKLKDKKYPELSIFGVNLPSILTNNYTTLFIFLSLCHIFCSTIFAFLQEKVMKMEGFKYPKSMTLIQTTTFTFCGLFEMIFGKEGNVFSPKAPLINYIFMSILTYLGMFCTNAGLKYISYPVRIIFKGAKPIPTMIIEFIYVGKKFMKIEILSVMILTCGVILFSFSDVKSGKNDSIWGIIFVSFGVLFDSFTSNYEKKKIFSHGSTHAEAMFLASLFGTIWTIITLFVTDYDYLIESLIFLYNYPKGLIWLILSSLGGYMSVIFILLLIKIFSTTYAECVKGVRKVVSIGASLVFFKDNSKNLTSMHIYGLTCFVISIVTTVIGKSQKKK